MRKLLDATGKEVEVPDEAELAQLKADAQAAADAKAKLATYESDDKIQNMRKLAESRDRMAEALRKQGKTVDLESGSVTEPASVASTDDARNIARQASEQFFIDQTIENAKASLDDNDKKIFDKMFPKAAFGEELNARTINKIISDAKAMAFGEEVTAPRRATNRSITRASFGGVPEPAKGEEAALSPLQADFVKRTGMRINPRKRT